MVFNKHLIILYLAISIFSKGYISSSYASEDDNSGRRYVSMMLKDKPKGDTWWRQNKDELIVAGITLVMVTAGSYMMVNAQDLNTNPIYRCDLSNLHLAYYKEMCCANPVSSLYYFLKGGFIQSLPTEAFEEFANLAHTQAEEIVVRIPECIRSYVCNFCRFPIWPASGITCNAEKETIVRVLECLGLSTEGILNMTRNYYM